MNVCFKIIKVCLTNIDMYFIPATPIRGGADIFLGLLSTSGLSVCPPDIAPLPILERMGWNGEIPENFLSWVFFLQGVQLLMQSLWHAVSHPTNMKNITQYMQ